MRADVELEDVAHSPQEGRVEDCHQTLPLRQNENDACKEAERKRGEGEIGKG